MNDLSRTSASVLNIDVHTDAERLRTTLNFGSNGHPAQVMILHGAGRGDRRRSEYLALEIARRGPSTIRFDFSGHGDSTGILEESSLSKRLREAITVSALLDPTRPITVIGNSMGGYIAARLTRYIRMDHLVLMCPAAYSMQAEATRFGSEFSAILREPGSFRTSMTFDDVKAFGGRVSLVIGSEDDVIPDEVITRYREAAAKADRSYDFLRLQGAPHLLHPWMQQNIGDRARFLKMLGFCR